MHHGRWRRCVYTPDFPAFLRASCAWIFVNRYQLSANVIQARSAARVTPCFRCFSAVSLHFVAVRSPIRGPVAQKVRRQRTRGTKQTKQPYFTESVRAGAAHAGHGVAAGAARGCNGAPSPAATAALPRRRRRCSIFLLCFCVFHWFFTGSEWLHHARRASASRPGGRKLHP